MEVEFEVYEVENLSAIEVLGRLEQLRDRFATGDYSILNRHNVAYCACSDGIKRLTLKKEQRFTVPQDGRREMLVKLVDLLIETIRSAIRLSLRWLFYRLQENSMKKIAESQGHSLVGDLCATIKCTSSSIFIDPGIGGLVAGHVSWKEKRLDAQSGEYLDFAFSGISRMEGMSIPLPGVEVTDLRLTGEVLFVLVVEKDCVLHRITQTAFYAKYPCIIISGHGTPTSGTKRFLVELTKKFKLRVFGLFDCDVGGIQILTNYTVGTKSSAFENVHLTCPEMEWVGFLPSDVCTLRRIPRVGLGPKKIKQIQELLREEFVAENPTLVTELNIMIEKNCQVNTATVMDLEDWESILERRLIERLQVREDMLVD